VAAARCSPWQRPRCPPSSRDWAAPWTPRPPRSTIYGDCRAAAGLAHAANMAAACAEALAALREDVTEAHGRSPPGCCGTGGARTSGACTSLACVAAWADSELPGAAAVLACCCIDIDIDYCLIYFLTWRVLFNVPETITSIL
jgi:hypothetical protein